MKRETLRHPKLYDLMARLNVSRPTALGHLQLLWDYTADHAIQGNVGKWADGAIAVGCEWHGDPAVFIEALVSAGWLDTDTTHRLLVHDWADHCERWVTLKLQRIRLTFIKPSTKASAEPSIERSVEGTGEGPGERSSNQSNPNQSQPNQGEGAEPQAAPALEGLSPVVVTLKLNTGPEYPIRQSLVDDWKPLYPAVDVLAELRKMSAWLDANPTKRKTKSGIKRFCVNWLNRAQDSGRGGASVPRGTSSPAPREFPR